MKLRIRYDVTGLIMGRWKGKVYYPFVLFKSSKENVTDILFRHELQHVYQVRRMGWFGFYLRYIWLGIRHGYKNHPFEAEANERENDPLTEEERKVKDES